MSLLVCSTPAALTAAVFAIAQAYVTSLSSQLLVEEAEVLKSGDGDVSASAASVSMSIALIRMDLAKPASLNLRNRARPNDGVTAAPPRTRARRVRLPCGHCAVGLWALQCLDRSNTNTSEPLHMHVGPLTPPLTTHTYMTPYRQGSLAAGNPSFSRLECMYVRSKRARLFVTQGTMPPSQFTPLYRTTIRFPALTQPNTVTESVRHVHM